MAIEALAMVMAAVVGIKEPTTGIDFPVPVEAPCVFVPDGARADDCPEVDPEKLSALLGPNTWFYVSTKDGKTTLLGRAVAFPGASSMSDENIDRFIAGAASAMTTQGKFVPASRGSSGHQVLTYGGLTVAEFTLEPDLDAQKASGKLIRVHGYLIPVKDTLVVMLETITGGDTEVVRKVMMGLKAPPGLKADTALFGTGGSFRLGQLVGKATCPAVLLIGAIVVVVRAMRRKKPSAPA